METIIVYFMDSFSLTTSWNFTLLKTITQLYSDGNNMQSMYDMYSIELRISSAMILRVLNRSCFSSNVVFSLVFSFGALKQTRKQLARQLTGNFILLLMNYVGYKYFRYACKIVHFPS